MDYFYSFPFSHRLCFWYSWVRRRRVLVVLSEALCCCYVCLHRHVSGDIFLHFNWTHLVAVSVFAVEVLLEAIIITILEALIGKILAHSPTALRVFARYSLPVRAVFIVCSETARADTIRFSRLLFRLVMSYFEGVDAF